MNSARSARRAFGQIPSFYAMAGVFAGAFLLVILGGLNDASSATLLALYVAYCIARPSDGWATFGAVLLPGWVAELSNFLGGPYWVGLPVLALSLLFAWGEDHGWGDEDPVAAESESA